MIGTSVSLAQKVKEDQPEVKILKTNKFAQNPIALDELEFYENGAPYQSGKVKPPPKMTFKSSQWRTMVVDAFTSENALKNILRINLEGVEIYEVYPEQIKFLAKSLFKENIKKLIKWKVLSTQVSLKFVRDAILFQTEGRAALHSLREFSRGEKEIYKNEEISDKEPKSVTKRGENNKNRPWFSTRPNLEIPLIFYQKGQVALHPSLKIKIFKGENLRREIQVIDENWNILKDHSMSSLQKITEILPNFMIRFKPFNWKKYRYGASGNKQLVVLDNKITLFLVLIDLEQGKVLNKRTLSMVDLLKIDAQENELNEDSKQILRTENLFSTFDEVVFAQESGRLLIRSDNKHGSLLVSFSNFFSDFSKTVFLRVFPDDSSGVGSNFKIRGFEEGGLAILCVKVDSKAMTHSRLKLLNLQDLSIKPLIEPGRHLKHFLDDPEISDYLVLSKNRILMTNKVSSAIIDVKAKQVVDKVEHGFQHDHKIDCAVDGVLLLTKNGAIQLIRTKENKESGELGAVQFNTIYTQSYFDEVVYQKSLFVTDYCLSKKKDGNYLLWFSRFFLNNNQQPHHFLVALEIEPESLSVTKAKRGLIDPKILNISKICYDHSKDLLVSLSTITPPTDEDGDDIYINSGYRGKCYLLSLTTTKLEPLDSFYFFSTSGTFLTVCPESGAIITKIKEDRILLADTNPSTKRLVLKKIIDINGGSFYASSVSAVKNGIFSTFIAVHNNPEDHLRREDEELPEIEVVEEEDSEGQESGGEGEEESEEDEETREKEDSNEPQTLFLEFTHDLRVKGFLAVQGLYEEPWHIDYLGDGKAIAQYFIGCDNPEIAKINFQRKEIVYYDQLQRRARFDVESGESRPYFFFMGYVSLTWAVFSEE